MPMRGGLVSARFPLISTTPPRVVPSQHPPQRSLAGAALTWFVLTAPPVLWALLGAFGWGQ